MTSNRVFEPMPESIAALCGRPSGDIAQAVADGTVNGEPTSYTCSVTGHEEGRATGLVAAEVVEHLYTSTTTPGVFRIEQLFAQLRELIERFSSRVTDMEYRFRISAT